jgi:hypothetical protein
MGTDSPERDRLVTCCAFCTRIRCPDGRWITIPEGVMATLMGRISHTYCPECLELYFPLLSDEHAAGI